MKSPLVALLPFCLAILAGCGDSADEQEPEPSISQGVYGVLVAGCDTSDCESSRITGEDVHVLVESPDPMTGEAGAPLASAVTDDSGMYEIAIEPGDYFLYLHQGVGWTDVSLGEGLMRCDWTSGPGGGNWECRRP